MRVVSDRMEYELALRRQFAPGLERGQRRLAQIQRTSDAGLIGLGLVQQRGSTGRRRRISQIGSPALSSFPEDQWTSPLGSPSTVLSSPDGRMRPWHRVPRSMHILVTAPNPPAAVSCHFIRYRPLGAIRCRRSAGPSHRHAESSRIYPAGRYIEDDPRHRRRAICRCLD